MPDENNASPQAPEPNEPYAYFVRESPARFRPTQYVGGAWDTREQHIAPPIGLLAHAIETDLAARRGNELRLTRLSCDILGVLPLESVEVKVSVLRPGRTIELVEARLSHAGRDAVIARAWLTARYDTTALQGSEFPRMKPRDQMAPWGLDSVWPGEFVKTPQIWREELAVGRAQFWVRSPVPLLADEDVSRTANMFRLIDISNGVAARVSPEDVLYPNLDLTAHLYRAPESDLTGLDTTVSFGPDGAGLTHSVLHDENGPLGAFSQTLTVRPR